MVITAWQLLRPKINALRRLGQVFFASKKTKISHIYTIGKQTAIGGALAFCVATATVPTHASVFDSLLKVLLPFYKDKEDVPPAPEDILEDVFEPSELPDIPTFEPPQNTLDLPSILLDDTLSADHIMPMLGEPDLFALLSAEFFADRGDVARALNIYKAESFKKNATAVFERALALSLEYEEPIESLHFATAWQMVNTDHIPAWFYVAHLALKAKDYNQATQMLAMILNYDKRADLTQILTGIFPTDPTDQHNLFYALQDVDGDNASISVLRAGLLLNMGDYPPALLHIDKALRAEPTNLAFINLKIDILRTAGLTDEMWAFIRDKRQKIPTEKDLHLYEIRHHIEQGQLEQAWQLLLVAHRQTRNPEVSLLTALVGIDIHRFKQASEILTALAKNPEYASRAYYYLGVSHERSGDIDDALMYYEKVKDRENVLDARTKAVGFYLLKGDVDKAMATLVRLREEYDIYTADSYILQAEILIQQGKKDLAGELLSNANRENPNDDRLLFASYQLLENELSDEDKRETLDKLLAIDPFHLEYQLADAKVRLLQNPDDQDAFATAQNISQLEVSDPAYDSQVQLEALLVLATHAYNKGEYQTVIGYLQAPYDVAPTLPVGIMLLRAYQGMGDNARVSELLDELQQRFAFGQNHTGSETQQY
ncbi:MAG: tetratricopeptide repeat protein [Moraxella sp.]|nr:tetratricopeptide repeat protein [Moraxella sp.]